MQENYHTHTYRCRHAIGSEEEYIRKAIDGGLKVLGFSDHTPFLSPAIIILTCVCTQMNWQIMPQRFWR